MARPREFEASEALQKAMYVFWSNGYEATSLSDILAATGLSKSSLYATFGDKRELFLATFQAYREERLRKMRLVLNDSWPARLCIEHFFRQVLARSKSEVRVQGCMIANEAVELAPHDDEIRHLVAEELHAFEDAFVEAIRRGQTDGSISSREEPRSLARFLVVNLQGLQVMASAKADLTALHAAVSVALSALD